MQAEVSLVRELKKVVAAAGRNAWMRLYLVNRSVVVDRMLPETDMLWSLAKQTTLP